MSWGSIQCLKQHASRYTTLMFNINHIMKRSGKPIEISGQYYRKQHFMKIWRKKMKKWKYHSWKCPNCKYYAWNMKIARIWSCFLSLALQVIKNTESVLVTNYVTYPIRITPQRLHKHGSSWGFSLHKNSTNLISPPTNKQLS